SEQVTVTGLKSSRGKIMSGAPFLNLIAGVVPVTAIQTYLPVSVQHPAPGDTSQYIGKEVTTRAIVTAFNPPSTYYVQQGSTINPSSGLIVFGPLFSVHPGDDVTFAGPITEFGGGSQATEYSGVDYQFVNATGVSIPAAAVATPGQVGVIAGSK